MIADRKYGSKASSKLLPLWFPFLGGNIIAQETRIYSEQYNSGLRRRHGLLYKHRFNLLIYLVIDALPWLHYGSGQPKHRRGHKIL